MLAIIDYRSSLANWTNVVQLILVEVTWEMGIMSRRHRISHKVKQSNKLQRPRQLESKVLANDDYRAQFDFRRGDVCLNVTTQYPPDMAKDPQIPEGLTFYVLRHYDGTLCMVADNHRSVIDYCEEHDLTYHQLQ